MFRLTFLNPAMYSQSWVADFARYQDAVDYVEKLQSDKIITRVSTSTTKKTTYALSGGYYYQILGNKL